VAEVADFPTTRTEAPADPTLHRLRMALRQCPEVVLEEEEEACQVWVVSAAVALEAEALRVAW